MLAQFGHYGIFRGLSFHGESSAARCKAESLLLFRTAGLQIRVRIGKLVSLFLIQNICCGYSKEPSH